MTEVLIENPKLNAFYFRGSLGNLSDLSSDEKEFYQYTALVVGFFERLFVLHSRNLVNEHDLATWERWFENYWFTQPSFEQFYKNEGNYLHVKFHEYLDRLYQKRQRIKAAPGAEGATQSNGDNPSKFIRSEQGVQQ